MFPKGQYMSSLEGTARATSNTANRVARKGNNAVKAESLVRGETVKAKKSGKRLFKYMNPAQGRLRRAAKKY